MVVSVSSPSKHAVGFTQVPLHWVPEVIGQSARPSSAEIKIP